MAQPLNVERFCAAGVRGGSDNGEILMQARRADGGHAVGALAVFGTRATRPPAADALGLRAPIRFHPALHRPQRVLPGLTIKRVVSLHILSERLVPGPRIPTLLSGTLPGRRLTLALLSEGVSHPALLQRDDTLDGHLVALAILVGVPHAALDG